MAVDKRRVDPSLGGRTPKERAEMTYANRRRIELAYYPIWRVRRAEELGEAIL